MGSQNSLTLPLGHTKEGKGKPMLLIHGFPMNRSVWSSFSKLLSAHFEVHTVDLPGFGESASTTAPVTIDDVAHMVNDWVRTHHLQQAVLVGHSLGGYVALAMADLQPDWFTGLVLFHSTALADSEEKKQSRNKVIEFVQRNGVESFTGSFIDPLFADRKHPAIEEVRQINLQTSEEAVVNYTAAMRDRPDRTHVLKQFRKPVLFIGGDNDPGIAPGSLQAQARLAGKGRVIIMTGTGHMGMFEQPSEAARAITEFATEATAPPTLG